MPITLWLVDVLLGPCGFGSLILYRVFRSLHKVVGSADMQFLNPEKT